MPIIDVGFVDAVRRGMIEVVPAVTALDGRAVVLADGSRVFPDAIVAATGYHPGLEPLVGDVTAIGEHGIPRPQPRLHFLGIGIPLSGHLYQIGKDARQTAASVARFPLVPQAGRESTEQIPMGSRPSSTHGLYGRRRLISKIAAAVTRPRTPLMIKGPRR